MNKAVTGVNMILHGGMDFGIYDDMDEQGHFVNNGVSALAALKRHEQIHAKIFVPDGMAEVIIPYHAVMEYDVMKEVIPFPDVADDFCVNRQDGGNNLVGSAIVGESTVGGE